MLFDVLKCGPDEVSRAQWMHGFDPPQKTKVEKQAFGFTKVRLALFATGGALIIIARLMEYHAGATCPPC